MNPFEARFNREILPITWCFEFLLFTAMIGLGLNILGVNGYSPNPLMLSGAVLLLGLLWTILMYCLVNPILKSALNSMIWQHQDPYMLLVERIKKEPGFENLSRTTEVTISWNPLTDRINLYNEVNRCGVRGPIDDFTVDLIRYYMRTLPFEQASVRRTIYLVPDP